ncbi:MAG: hypothetical protein WCD55_09655, partial [Bacteroidales bacterium]
MKFKYKCTDCGKEYGNSALMYLCPSCGAGNDPSAPPKGVLNILYGYDEISKTISGFTDLKKKGFIQLLPIKSIKSLPPLR